LILPDDAVVDFLEGRCAAAATLAHWDRGEFGRSAAP